MNSKRVLLLVVVAILAAHWAPSAKLLAAVVETLLIENHHHTHHCTEACCHGLHSGDGSTGTAVSSFVTTGTKWPQNVSGAPVTISYSYNNFLDGGLLDPSGSPLSPNFLRSSVEEALGLWASVSPLHFVEVSDEGGPVVMGNYPSGQYGQIRFHHRYINGPDSPACFESGANPGTCGAKAKAQAYFPGGGNQAGDVYYDHGDRWRAVGTLTEPDVLGATVHELGHSLGLHHTSIPSANMYWIFQRSSGLGTASLHPDDIAGIQAIYGAGVGSVTPLIVVPESSTGLLLLVAASLLSGLRLKRVTAVLQPCPYLS